MKKHILTLAFALVMLTSLVLMSGCSESYDFVATVKAWKPFENSQGLPGTYGTVLDKYIDNCTWTANKASDTEASVVTKGKLTANGAVRDIQIIATVSITGDSASMRILSGEIDGESFNSNDMAELLIELFAAHNEGYATLDDYFNS